MRYYMNAVFELFVRVLITGPGPVEFANATDIS